MLSSQPLTTCRGSIEFSSLHSSDGREAIKRRARPLYRLGQCDTEEREVRKEEKCDRKFTEDSEQSQVQSRDPGSPPELPSEPSVTCTQVPFR